MFPFEKLIAYQRAVRLFEFSEEIRRTLKGRVGGDLLDQLGRASLSVSLNLAEGAGRWHTKEKRQFFRIARGSAFECVPIYEILRRAGLISESKYEEIRSCLEELCRTLAGLIRVTPKTVPHSF